MINMEEYVSEQTTVFAAEITEQTLGEVVQELYDNGAYRVSIQTYKVNPLDPTSTDVSTTLLVTIRGETLAATIGDYIVEQEVGEVVTKRVMVKEVFESLYSPVLPPIE